jgi:N-acetyl-anhydromuramyl-L-alanine amidase AmpD
MPWELKFWALAQKGKWRGVIGAQANSRISEGDRGFTDEQYAALNGLLSLLTSRYHIPADRIISHEEYDPGRKWDPGDLFEWERIRLQ